jgi:hypothetical protein
MVSRRCRARPSGYTSRMNLDAGPRVSAVRFPASYELPAVPEQAHDAYRQTSFLLKSDIRTFEAGMQLQVKLANAASHSSFRTQPYSALIGLWSRTFLALADGYLLVTRGSYGTALPLVRSACEHIAAQQHLQRAAMPEYLEWLAGSLTPDEQHKAVDTGLGRYDAERALADDGALDALYRCAGDLARPNFGATLLLVGPESNHQRLALVFADNAFHVGWAQLTLGWLLRLCERQVAFIAAAEDVFGGDEERRAEVAEFSGKVEQALGRPDRCRIEEIEHGGEQRYLLHNFRRTPGGAAKKILL